MDLNEESRSGHLGQQHIVFPPKPFNKAEKRLQYKKDQTPPSTIGRPRSSVLRYCQWLLDFLNGPDKAKRVNLGISILKTKKARPDLIINCQGKFGGLLVRALGIITPFFLLAFLAMLNNLDHVGSDFIRFRIHLVGILSCISLVALIYLNNLKFKVNEHSVSFPGFLPFRHALSQLRFLDAKENELQFCFSTSKKVYLLNSNEIKYTDRVSLLAFLQSHAHACYISQSAVDCLSGVQFSLDDSDNDCLDLHFIHRPKFVRDLIEPFQSAERRLWRLWGYVVFIVIILDTPIVHKYLLNVGQRSLSLDLFPSPIRVVCRDLGIGLAWCIEYNDILISASLLTSLLFLLFLSTLILGTAKIKLTKQGIEINAWQYFKAIDFKILFSQCKRIALIAQ